MKKLLTTISLLRENRVLPMTAVMFLLPVASHAQNASAGGMIPVEMNLASYLIVGFLLVLSITMFFVFQRRFNAANKELQDITIELGTARQRLTKTAQELEQSQKDLKVTTNHYQSVLYDANVGMFQMDLYGNCTYVNSALQEMSGLYMKKAIKEGLASTIHVDDRQRFNDAWLAFAKGDQPFNETFRFSFKKGREVHEVHATCRINKIINAKNELESYIGWVTDVTPFHEQLQLQRTETAHYGQFVSETMEGYYKLIPASPITLSASASKVAEAVMNKMVLADCNDLFAAMYGTKPNELKGKPINELPGGCGPFKDTEAFTAFVEADCKVIDLESVRNDVKGNRLNLVNSVVGIVEGNKLVAIWGAQRNISQQKRETAKLGSQIDFLNRILNALPADVTVKDTRCRYLYASKKLADRTGIEQQEWIGKTIFEVLPGTSRDHDHAAIQTMKSGKRNRTETPYDACGKSGWMESIQIPLVSSEGLVEGVIGLSLDISARKKQEEEVVRYSSELEQQLKQTRGELSKSENEHGKTATALSDAIQKLKLVEVEKLNRENEYKQHLAKQKRVEETLRRSEGSLLACQRELEEQLSKRLAELKAETDKRKKWEELLAIKEQELRKIEAHSIKMENECKQETELRTKAESNLAAIRSDLENVRVELNTLTENRQKEIDSLNAQLKLENDTEHQARTTAEKQLKKTEDLLQRTQEEIQQLNSQHSVELEHEISERKAAAEKLMKSMEELDDLRQQFNQRIEDETKAIKQQLAQKQIHEKALRQHEKELEERIKELEKMLDSKAREYAEQLQAKEGAEVQKQQIEQKLERVSKRQQELVARETQKFQLHIAEIRLDEVKLRKQVGDLQRDKESLEDRLITRNIELEKSEQEIQKTKGELMETENRLERLSNNQAQLIASETDHLRAQLEKLQQNGENLRAQLEDLQHAKQAVDDTLETRTADLAKAAREYRRVVDAYKDSQSKIKQLADEQDALLARQTKSMEEELQQLRNTETELRNREKQLQDRHFKQQQRIDALLDNLNTETAKRKSAEKEMHELQAALEANQEDKESFIREQTRKLRDQVEELSISEGSLKQELENAKKSIIQRDESITAVETERKQAETRIAEIEHRLAGIKEEHQAELKKSLAEVKEISRMNSDLVDELNDTLREALDPVVKTTLVMEKADNLLPEQKRDLANAGQNCRSLIDMIGYRNELTHLANGSDSLRLTHCDLHGLMADIDSQYSQRAATKKLFFAVSFAQYQAAHNVPKIVETDEYKVRKILSILLAYAIEKTEKGRLGLHATRKSSSKETANISFELAYTGKENRDRLLDAIFTPKNGEEVVDAKHGLTLARRYVGMLDGEVALEYRAGGITSLTVQFPFKKVVSTTNGMTAETDKKKVGAA